MKKEKIELSRPYFFGDEKKFLLRTLENKWISSGGKFTRIFENKVKRLTQSKYVLGLVNCSFALQLAVRLLKPKLNEEILVPTITFISTINAVVHNYCKPIFIDTDDDFLIDTKKIIMFLQNNTFSKNNFCYNKKTKKKILGLILVDTFGNLNKPSKKLVNICKKKNIKIILDSAESLGSKYKKNKDKGFKNFANFTCLSFNGNKLITSGGGGVILFNDKKNYNEAVYLASQAKDNKTYFIHNQVGYNLRLSDLHSAIGLSQLKYLDKVLLKKKKIHNQYKVLNKIKGLRILENPSYSSSNNWLNILIIEKDYKIKKELIIEKFRKLGIETRSVWFPNHLQKPFKKYQKFKIEKAYELYKKSLCLPSSYDLKYSDQKKIISLLTNNFKK